jgi:fructosamine-3-kinase
MHKASDAVRYREMRTSVAGRPPRDRTPLCGQPIRSPLPPSSARDGRLNRIDTRQAFLTKLRGRGPPEPTLLHGDAQQNNIVITAGGPVLIDASPYFGHPEIDLAMVDIFEPVPDALFAGYRERATIDDGFDGRRELWRVFAYLAVIALDGANPFGRSFVPRLAGALAHV